MTGPIRFRIELRIDRAGQRRALPKVREYVARDAAIQHGITQAVAHYGLPVDSAAPVLRGQEAVLPQIEAAVEVDTHADRPGDWARIEGQSAFNLIEELEWIAALAVNLVDEGDDWDVAQPAHLEKLARLAFDTFGASTTMIAESAAVSVRYVSSLKSW